MEYDEGLIKMKSNNRYCERIFHLIGRDGTGCGEDLLLLCEEIFHFDLIKYFFINLIKLHLI